MSNTHTHGHGSGNTSSNGNSNPYCNNCGKCGHILNDCKNPITSIGIISFKYNNLTNSMEYLLIQRNNSFGFVEFIRGKYPLYNINTYKR